MRCESTLRFGALALTLGMLGCGPPDPRSVEGALGYAAARLESDDMRGLYDVIDERSRHAMISIVADRERAAAVIRQSYPRALREAALASLGDAATVQDAAGLFAERCDAACRDDLRSRVAAPRTTRREGDEVVVTTVLGTEVRLYRRQPGHWYGIVWHTDELDRERSRANRDLAMIRSNGATYARRRQLETPGAHP